MNEYQGQKVDLEDYLSRHSSEEPLLLQKVAKQTKMKFPNAHMISGAYQGRLLSLISKMLSPKKILEIGTFTGYATLCLAEGLAQDGKITTIDRDPRMPAFYTPFFAESKYREQIIPILADAMEYIPQQAITWDLVFLDGNKRKYLDYFDILIPMMPSGGVILADNVLWKRKVLFSIDSKDKMTQAIDEFNKKIASDPRVEIVMLPIRDGISLIRKI